MPDLDFGEAPHVGGFAGCNRYKGQYEINAQGQFRIPQVATTMRMCADNAMAFEQRYTAVLSQWHQVRVVDNELSLSSGDEVWLFTLQDWVQ